MEQMQFRHGAVREFPDDVEQTRTIQFVLSTSAKDRHGTVLNQDNWKLDNFNRNGVVGYQHNLYGDNFCSAPNPDDVIGAGRAWVENRTLYGEVKFEPADINPLAEKIFRKILHGSLKATSVGFVPTGDGKWGEKDESQYGSTPTFYYEGQELLEFCIVNIPSNPEALKRSLKSQTQNALLFIHRSLNGMYRTDQIMDMTVATVIDLVEGRELRTIPGKSISEIEAEYRQAMDVVEVLKNELDRVRRLKDYFEMKSKLK
jgi:hypothetical protein